MPAISVDGANVDIGVVVEVPIDALQVRLQLGVVQCVRDVIGEVTYARVETVDDQRRAHIVARHSTDSIADSVRREIEEMNPAHVARRSRGLDADLSRLRSVAGKLPFGVVVEP